MSKKHDSCNLFFLRKHDHCLWAPCLPAHSLRALSLWAPSLRAPSLRAPSLRAPSLRAPSLRAPSLRVPSLRALPLGTASGLTYGHPTYAQQVEKFINKIARLINFIYKTLSVLCMAWLKGLLINCIPCKNHLGHNNEFEHLSKNLHESHRHKSRDLHQLLIL